MSNNSDLQDLVDMASEHNIGVEDRRSIRYLCHECSLGKPEEYVVEPAPLTSEPIVIGVVSQTEDAMHMLTANWLEVHQHRNLANPPGTTVVKNMVFSAEGNYSSLKGGVA